MERKLGEIFQYNDEDRIVTLQVVKQDSCNNCFFLNDNTGCKAEDLIDNIGYCYLRNDATSVIFKQIK